MKLYAYLILMTVFAVPFMAMAQDAAEAQNADNYLKENGISPAPEAPVAPVAAKAEEKAADVAAAEKPQESPDMIAKKAELARKMHQIRPTRVQVDSAIEQAARGMPEADRGPFVTAMKSVLNYNAIEKISVDAMVETFTLPELAAMVEYHSKPEAQSVSQKMPQWAMKVQPEVVRMIDSAMMRVKTGAPAPQ